MRQIADVIIWQETPTIKLQTMFIVYSNGLISQIISTSTSTVSRHCEAWQFQEYVQFAMFAGYDVTFHAVGADFSNRQTANFKRLDVPATC
jgi:hypothetical protein